MSELAQNFIASLVKLKERDRGALARLKRSLTKNPGADPCVYPLVEPFVGQDRPAEDPWRLALYLTGGLFALNPNHREGPSLAGAFGTLVRVRDSESLETRFMALLEAEPERLAAPLRQVVALLASESASYDYVRLLDDLARWLNPWDLEGMDRLRQRWARDFYLTFDRTPASTNTVAQLESNT